MPVLKCVNTYTYKKTHSLHVFICQESHSRKHEISSTKRTPLENFISHILSAVTKQSKNEQEEKEVRLGSALKGG